jgi:hypothetical protein
MLAVFSAAEGIVLEQQGMQPLAARSAQTGSPSGVSTSAP